MSDASKCSEMQRVWCSCVRNEHGVRSRPWAQTRAQVGTEVETLGGAPVMKRVMEQGPDGVQPAGKKARTDEIIIKGLLQGDANWRFVEHTPHEEAIKAGDIATPDEVDRAIIRHCVLSVMPEFGVTLSWFAKNLSALPPVGADKAAALALVGQALVTHDSECRLAVQARKEEVEPRVVWSNDNVPAGAVPCVKDGEEADDSNNADSGDEGEDEDSAGEGEEEEEGDDESSDDSVSSGESSGSDSNNKDKDGGGLSVPSMEEEDEEKAA